MILASSSWIWNSDRLRSDQQEGQGHNQGKTKTHQDASGGLKSQPEKRYILEEARRCRFYGGLRGHDPEGKIVHSKYDKFRQINRFLEFVEDIREELPKDREVTILDFGCGKSYLTFALYYYLKVLHGLDIRIIGLDLKEDVIEHCDALARDYGYD